MKQSPAFPRRAAARERASAPLLALLVAFGASAQAAAGQARSDARQSAEAASPAARPSAVHTNPKPAAAIPTDAEGSPLDPIAVLQQQIAEGKVVLEFDDQFGYLPALLEALDIPVSSQGLVFSRTSLQTNLIAPWSPRALYFNDDVYIGYVQGSSFIEIASVDPDDGGAFYTMPQDEVQPQFHREGTTCLMCHESKAVTGGVPGFIVRSVLVDRLGYPITPLQNTTVSDRTPFEERMGGYYVTGTHENAVHSGNTLAPVLSHEVVNPDRYLSEFDMTSDGNVTSLEGRFDLEPYLSPHSDIVALLVLGHQTQVHNLITVAHEVAAEALSDLEIVRRFAVPGAPEPKIAPATQVAIDGAVQRLVRAMLFSREAPLAGAVKGTSGFTEEFEALGPEDSQGRSFRDFDLQTRLFRYPMSFLIYSDAFVTLPDIIKKPFYERVAAVLDGRDQSPDFEHLSDADRKAIREILVETKPEFVTFTSGAPKTAN